MLHLPPSEYRWLSPAVTRSSPGGECGALPNAIGSSGPSSSMDNSGSAQMARGPAAEHPEAHKPRLNSEPPSPDTGGSAPAAFGPAAGLPDRPEADGVLSQRFCFTASSAGDPSAQRDGRGTRPAKSWRRVCQIIYQRADAAVSLRRPQRPLPSHPSKRRNLFLRDMPPCNSRLRAPRVR
ncbi:hypothetical protein SKAU_G00165050 [Synaphobranchus kaupii]|uniref:Uncharacterized protein n=1 Tax=Synaphobranchus kaupii TaxID=118154 RepID=A0A9Q1FJ95_SYNKA|nr:hypothetical protein SKAU_G00165050 [Synaphobranchus kaupii]